MLRIMTHVPAKVKFSYPLDEARFVIVDDNKDMTIGDLNTIAKRALLNAPRWVKLVEEMEEIDTVVERAATPKPTKYKFHVGDNWFISISDELPFVDICRCTTSVVMGFTFFLLWSALRSRLHSGISSKRSPSWRI